MSDPTNVRAVDDISIMTGLDVRPAVASAEDIDAAVSNATRLDSSIAEAIEEDEEETGGEVTEIRESAGDAPVIKLVNGVIAKGIEEGVSDIHFEPEGKDMRVRYRVDGILHDATTVPRRMVAGVTSRLKIMASLDIAEKRLPQDGRVGLNVEGHPIDIRMASLPSVKGEKVVLRILDKEQALIGLERLGMQDDTLDRFQKSFTRSYGATFVTGPTGSGKTTSLYAALNQINSPERNIITIEDPVEYQIPGLTQVQVNLKAGLTFSSGLRSIVRSDPDVIMVGEIRDKQTAQIAIESALTGHLVLSTLHTNDAPTAISRLSEMGIEPFLTASALDCVVSQRLARLLCSHCREARAAARRRDAHLRRRGRHGGLSGQGLQALWVLRLQGTRRPLRGDDGHEGDPGAGDRARVRRPHRRHRDRAGHAHPPAGRHRQGPHGAHLDPGNCPNYWFGNGCRLRRNRSERRRREAHDFRKWGEAPSI